MKKLAVSQEEKKKAEEQNARIRKMMAVPVKPQATSHYWFTNRGLY